MLSLRRAALALGLVALAAPMLASQAAPTYHVARRIQIGGDGGFDYVTADPAMRRVFLTHASHVVVYDLAKDAVAGDIPNTTGVHGVALAPDLGRGFTSNGRDSSVTIFDYHTLAVIKVLPIHAINPDAITYDDVTKRIFTWNHGTHNATVIDAAKGEVIGTIPNLGTPETAVTDGKGSLWVNLEDSSMVVRIDTRTMKETARFSIAPCDGPTGLAMDRADRILFSVCDGAMAVVNADLGTLITSVGICAGPDAAAYDPQAKLAFASCGDGTLSIVRAVSPTEFKLVQTVTTQRGARTMALDPTTHTVYQMAVEYGPAAAPATPGGRAGRAPAIPGSFSLLIVSP
jgi:DNA-binding beta-propeller fold protein YncE